jgi:hypothetical protein
MSLDPTIRWLLSGDVSIQYQTYRDLLNQERADLRKRMSTEGWGARFLSLRKEDGHWGKAFYSPKWTSTHYTLLDLRNLEIDPELKELINTVEKILKHEKGDDGGINPHTSTGNSDVCLSGMVLNYSAYFGAEDELLQSIVDFLLSQHMPDGGYNCHSNYKGAVHSSLHSTLSVAEGIREYGKQGYTYRSDELFRTELAAREFILQHKLFLSDRTGKIIKPAFLMLSYPSRWKYDILRCLDYFRSANMAHEERMKPAIEILLKKRRKDNKWPLQAKYAGQTHFDMEKPGRPSRWNTLRALRVLKHFEIS